MTDHAVLRAKLIQMRDGALADLAAGEHLSSGLMRLATDADAVLSVIDRAADSPYAPTGGRIVVTHPDPGQPITVTVYRGADTMCQVDISTYRAIALAGDLIDAARRELI